MRSVRKRDLSTRCALREALVIKAPLLNRRQVACNRCGGGAADRVSPATRTHTHCLARLGYDVVDDVVGTRRIGTYPRRNMIQVQSVACTPGDVVVCTGRISTNPNCPYQRAFRVVEREAATENIHTDPYAQMTDAELATELERLGIEPTLQ